MTQKEYIWANLFQPLFMKRLFLFALLFANLTIVFPQSYKFYALSSDQGVSKPVSLCELDSVTGAISIDESYSGVVKGNYYALSSDYKHLLVTSVNAAKNQGGLIQYDISGDGKLTLVESRLKSGGIPCHVSFSSDMKYAFSANYNDDEISLYNFTNKTVSAEIDHVVKPDQSKGHFIFTDPSDKFVHAVFLGLDKVYSFKIEDGKFVTNVNQEYFSLPEGYGPRHLVFHPDSNWVYILNETHSSVTAGSYDSETGVITEIQNITMLPAGYFGKNSAAAIRLHPNGRFLYASNRGFNSIAVYEIDDDGLLSIVEYETSGINWPRDFNISSDGKFMVVGNQKGNSIFSFRIDESTGELTKTGMELSMSSPLSFQFLPSSDEGTVGISLEGKTSNHPGTIFPNPAIDKLHIVSTDESVVSKIELYNLSGQLVKCIVKEQISTIDVSDLPGGAYLLVGSTEAGKFNHTVIIQ